MYVYVLGFPKTLRLVHYVTAAVVLLTSTQRMQDPSMGVRLHGPIFWNCFVDPWPIFIINPTYYGHPHPSRSQQFAFFGPSDLWAAHTIRGWPLTIYVSWSLCAATVQGTTYNLESGFNLNKYGTCIDVFWCRHLSLFNLQVQDSANISTHPRRGGYSGDCSIIKSVHLVIIIREQPCVVGRKDESSVFSYLLQPKKIFFSLYMFRQPYSYLPIKLLKPFCWPMIPFHHQPAPIRSPAIFAWSSWDQACVCVSSCTQTQIRYNSKDSYFVHWPHKNIAYVVCANKQLCSPAHP